MFLRLGIAMNDQEAPSGGSSTFTLNQDLRRVEGAHIIQLAPSPDYLGVKNPVIVRPVCVQCSSAPRTLRMHYPLATAGKGLSGLALMPIQDEGLKVAS